MAFHTLFELELGSCGREYVKSCLEQGSGLCAKVLQLNSALSGKCFAPLPEHVDYNRAISFKEGGLTSMRASNEWLFHRFRSMPESDRLALIIHDVWAKPTDAAFRRSPHAKFFTQGEVYYLVRRSDLSEYVFLDAVKTHMSYLFVAFLSCLPAKATIDSGQPVDELVIGEIAGAVREVYVSAYDQEGLVAWSLSAVERRSVQMSA